MTEVDQSLVATLKRNQLSAGESAVLVKVTRGQDLNGVPRGGEHVQRPRAQQGSWGVRSKGKVLGWAGECSSEEGAWPRKLERGARAVPPRTETLGLDPVGNESQKTGSRVVSHLSMTVDLWESCLNTSIFYTFFNGICFLFIKK